MLKRTKTANCSDRELVCGCASIGGVTSDLIAFLKSANPSIEWTRQSTSSDLIASQNSICTINFLNDVDERNHYTLLINGSMSLLKLAKTSDKTQRSC